MVKILEEIDLGHDFAKLSLGYVAELDLLYGDSFSIHPIETSIDGAKGTATETVSKLIVA